MKRHSDFVATQCPGNWDLARLDAIARTKDGSGDWGVVTDINPPVVVPPIVIPPVNPLQAKVDQLEQNIVDLNTTITAKQLFIGDLVKQISDLQTKNGELQHQLATLLEEGTTEPTVQSQGIFTRLFTWIVKILKGGK